MEQQISSQKQQRRIDTGTIFEEHIEYKLRQHQEAHKRSRNYQQPTDQKVDDRRQQDDMNKEKVKAFEEVFGELGNEPLKVGHSTFSQPNKGEVQPILLELQIPVGSSKSWLEISETDSGISLNLVWTRHLANFTSGPPRSLNLRSLQAFCRGIFCQNLLKKGDRTEEDRYLSFVWVTNSNSRGKANAQEQEQSLDLVFETREETDWFEKKFDKLVDIHTKVASQRLRFQEAEAKLIEELDGGGSS